MQIEFLLCYACAGSRLEMGYLLRTGNPRFCSLLGPVDTSTVLGKIRVIHAALLSYGILTQQVHQLPLHFTPLHSSVARGDGGFIYLAEHDVQKRVPWPPLREAGQSLDRLKSLYNSPSVKSSACVVHAVKGPDIENDLYTVDLEPLGTKWPFGFASANQLVSAIRCGGQRPAPLDAPMAGVFCLDFFLCRPGGTQLACV